MIMKWRMIVVMICGAFPVYAAEAFAPCVDFSVQSNRHVVIVEGTPEIYQGHATMVLLPDGKTLFAVWTIGHGGSCGPAAMSNDGGLTWKRVDDRFPAEYATFKNCPAIYRMTSPDGRDRLWVFACGGSDRQNERSTQMTRVMSEDDGKTWRVMPAIPVTCVMPMCSIMRLKDGSHIGHYNDRWPEQKKRTNRVFQMLSRDGGLTWTDAHPVAQNPDLNLCEPFLIRSPDGNEICAILRENWHKTLNSRLIFSCDEGQTWSAPEESAWALTGDRHHGVQLKDGRWVIAFRDRATDSPSKGHFVGWIGTYDDIRNKRAGYRIKLLHSYAGSDCGYAALALLPDETVIATTYIKYWNDKRRHSVVGVRFNPADLVQ